MMMSTRSKRHTDLASLLELAAREHADHGIICHGPPMLTQTYPQLLDHALRLLGGLHAQGVTAGRRVALLLERPEEFVPVLWACLLGGLVPCPLVPVRADPQRWAAQLAHIDRLFDHPVLVTTDALRAELPHVRGLRIVELAELAGHGPAVPHHGQPEDLALLVLTSGSTGNPKAVMLTQGNLLAAMSAKAQVQHLTQADVTLNWVSFDHVAALLETHLFPLSAGAVQVHATPEAILRDPVLFLELISRYRVTMTFTPNFLLGLINTAPLRDLDLDLSCLKKIISGGEANVVTTGIAFLDRLQPYGLEAGVLWPAFGMTETCAGSLYNTDFPDADLEAEFASVGRPAAGLRTRIADDGELQLTGPMVTGGYLADAEATAAAFTDDGWFRTGDLGHLRDGRLTLIGRSKDSIILNGVNYFSQDLETVLESLAGIDRSYLAAFPVRPPGGDSEQLVVAFAATVGADSRALYDLIVAVRNSVVLHWGFRPALVLPLAREDFPKTSLGKIQRSLMRQRLESGRYDDRRRHADTLARHYLGPCSPPQGDTETALTAIYADLFAMPPRDISATASFFDLGGTSLDILRLKTQISARFPAVTLPTVAILTAPSIRELARQVISSTRAVAYDPIVPLQTKGTRTPLFCVHPGVGEVLVFVNLARYFTGERPFYALRARGLTPGEKPFASFPEMVRTYLDAIRSRQPNGPYAIAGYSFGAVVAFELAKALEAEGERVDFLGSFNLPPHISYRMIELDFTETAVNLAMFLQLISKQQALELPQRLRPLPIDAQMARLIDLAPPQRLAELDLDQPKLTEWARLSDALTSLGRTYEPAGTVRSISVFCADPLRGSRQDWIDKELRRWDEHTREPNRYLNVPGEHYTMLAPENLPAFQAALKTELKHRLRDS
jgi:acyl-CoA synthetase (AMP-forming)/AMP-acid ligase II/thioesterase domain-containing protein